MKSHIQYKITETNQAGQVYIYDDRGATLIFNQFATAAEVAAMLQVSRSSAYRIMGHMPAYQLEDHRQPGEIHRFIVVKRSDLAAFRRSCRGNPHFSDPKYQRSLAQRPRKKKLDT